MVEMVPKLPIEPTEVVAKLLSKNGIPSKLIGA
jgi:hypothetical protein